MAPPKADPPPMPLPPFPPLTPPLEPLAPADPLAPAARLPTNVQLVSTATAPWLMKRPPPLASCPPEIVSPRRVKFVTPGMTVKSRKRLLPAMVTLFVPASRVTLLEIVSVLVRTIVVQFERKKLPPCCTAARNSSICAQSLVRVTVIWKSWLLLAPVLSSVTASRRVYEGVAACVAVGLQVNTALVGLLLVSVAPGGGALRRLNTRALVALSVAWARLVKMSVVPSVTVWGGIGSITTPPTGVTPLVTVTVKVMALEFNPKLW